MDRATRSFLAGLLEATVPQVLTPTKSSTPLTNDSRTTHPERVTGEGLKCCFTGVSILEAEALHIHAKGTDWARLSAKREYDGKGLPNAPEGLALHWGVLAERLGHV
eukprot:10008756-Alexandrium_andersonii.AAC.1